MAPKSKRTVWALTDDRAGNNAQVLGIAEKLGLVYKTKEVQFNCWAKLPNFLKGKSLVGVQNKQDFDTKDFPDVIISAGRKLAPIALYIKKLARAADKEIKLVHLMNPEICQKEFDLLILPEHDNAANQDNVLEINGSPSKINKKFLEKEKKAWGGKFKDFQKPFIVVLVGGSNKHGEFTEADAINLAKQASNLAKKTNSSLLITTSRRTTPDVRRVLRANLKQPFYLFDFNASAPVLKPSFKNNQQGKMKMIENPYFGLLSVADEIIVTSDSIAMISESLLTKKPVYIYESTKTISPKHRSFLDKCYGENYAAILGESFDAPPAEFPDEAERVVECIKELIK